MSASGYNYAPTRDALTREIVALQKRMDIKGLFASIVAFKRRLTGELAKDQRTLESLQKSRASGDSRASEIRADVHERSTRAVAAMENRHKCEQDRDKRYLAWRERGERSSSTWPRPNTRVTSRHWTVAYGGCH